MRMTPATLLFSAMIAVSYFLPWIDAPMFFSGGPKDLFANINPNMIDLKKLSDAPPEVFLFLLFFLSFPVAGFTALSSLFGSCSRSLAILTGGIPLGLAAYIVIQSASNMPKFKFPTSMEGIGDYVGLGIVFYFLGASALILLAMIDPGKKTATPPG